MMKTNREVLSSILKTTQMGQVGIRSVLEQAMGSELRAALESQLREYDVIESEAHAISSERGWELPELPSGIRGMTDLMTRMKLSYGNCDSNIAAMMIQGNTKGMVKGLKNQHQFQGRDGQVRALSQRLLDCETANIQQMQPFL